jgi:hypothetical protein
MAGAGAIAIAAESHLDSFLQRFNAKGLDVDAAIKEGRCIPVYAVDTLSTFM